ncbi:MAG: hypothetical protein ACREJD_05860 [Phycisphaerales bacterium]
MATPPTVRVRLIDSPESRRKYNRVERAAFVLRHRLRFASWWRGVSTLYPGGVVTFYVARRMLGISLQRLNELVEQGRIPEIAPPAELQDMGRWVPFDSLLGAPTLLESGRPVRRRRMEGQAAREGPNVNPWGSVVDPTTTERVFGENPEGSPKKVTKYRWEKT